jgi:uncharacterized protein (DUF608 family)
MKNKNGRRSFIKQIAIGSAGAAVSPTVLLAQNGQHEPEDNLAEGKKARTNNGRAFNGAYKKEELTRIAFPIGGIGAGMFCLEGAGALSHMSIRNKPEVFNEPGIFAAICIPGLPHGAKLLEGPVPEWKLFGAPGTGNGAAGATYGLPRFSEATFEARFPFGTVKLSDPDLPLAVTLTGWSPFIPLDEDNSSLPVGCLEYSFTNRSNAGVNAVFSFNTRNFLATEEGAENRILPADHGFVLQQAAAKEKPQTEGYFAVFTDDPATVVDHCWFRGGWWDPLTMAWNRIRDGAVTAIASAEKNAPGASIYLPFSLAAGKTKNVKVSVAWFVPQSDLHVGEPGPDEKKDCDPLTGCCSSPSDLGISESQPFHSPNYKPWYSGRFQNITELITYWKAHQSDLYDKTRLFTKAFYECTLPPEVMEAVAANLTILKSPTVLRQPDGRMWNWEGCGDNQGCCHGSCTHVWNYAQALPHLFPTLERSLRHTEFCENQNMEGHQGFRANMPISPVKHDFHAAADGQLGGILKVYREWRISGDGNWLRKIFPMVEKSMDYCIRTWDPRGRGIVEEPHHNTYDIEFWGPDGMCTSFYLGALSAMIAMGKFLGASTQHYQDLYQKGRQFMEEKLYDGEYFFQDIEYKGLNAPDPATAKSYGGEYSAEAIAMLQKEGPKYQYGKGCLSDGVLGAWIGKMCGLPDFIDPSKIKSHLAAVYKYNLRKDLREHANPQRPAYALGREGGLLLCTWPKGGKLSLPFVYSDEVWTGIEYQVASHLMLEGKVREGLEIVQVCRSRYDGRVRNPFNEYECGHWYARAMSSYGLMQGLTGLRYDAVDQTVYINSRIGDFTCFLCTATGFGTVTLRNGKASLHVYLGTINAVKYVLGDFS